MKITKENIHAYMHDAKLNTKLYVVTNRNILGYLFIAAVERNKGFYAYSSSDVHEVIFISEYSADRMEVYTDYTEAKFALLRNAEEEVECIKRIYMADIPGLNKDAI